MTRWHSNVLSNLSLVWTSFMVRVSERERRRRRRGGGEGGEKMEENWNNGANGWARKLWSLSLKKAKRKSPFIIVLVIVREKESNRVRISLFIQGIENPYQQINNPRIISILSLSVSRGDERYKSARLGPDQKGFFIIHWTLSEGNSNRFFSPRPIFSYLSQKSKRKIKKGFPYRFTDSVLILPKLSLPPPPPPLFFYSLTWCGSRSRSSLWDKRFEFWSFLTGSSSAAAAVGAVVMLTPCGCVIVYMCWWGKPLTSSTCIQLRILSTPSASPSALADWDCYLVQFYVS